MEQDLFKEAVRPWLIELFNDVKREGRISQAHLKKGFELLLIPLSGLDAEELIEEIKAGMTLDEFLAMLMP